MNCKKCGKQIDGPDYYHGLCPTCHCDQNAIVRVPDAFIHTKTPPTASDAVAVPSGAVSGDAKVKRTVKNSNAKRDVWIEREFKAEARVRELEAELNKEKALFIEYYNRNHVEIHRLNESEYLSNYWKGRFNRILRIGIIMSSFETVIGFLLGCLLTHLFFAH